MKKKNMHIVYVYDEDEDEEEEEEEEEGLPGNAMSGYCVDS
jgi:hypothetical protein